MIGWSWRDASTVMAAGAVLLSARRARVREVGPIEEGLFRVANDGPDEIDLPLWAVMQSGSLGAVFVVSGWLVRQGRIRAAVMSTITGVTVWGGVKAIKPLIGRGRPDCYLDRVVVRGPSQTGLGYPSGHAAVATVLAIIATSHLEPLERAAALATAGMTGGARMYAGAHLPLDVVGGMAIGLLCGRAARSILADLGPATPRSQHGLRRR